MFVRKKLRWGQAKPPTLPSIGTGVSPGDASRPAAVKSEIRPAPPSVRPEPKKPSLPQLPTPPVPTERPDGHARAVGVVNSRQDPTPGRLVIGRQIRFKGEITACDELVVEGYLDAAVVAQHLKISSDGAVAGRFEVRTADIGGRFTGDLIVRENLSIRAGGQVEGRVRYGTIEVALGGVVKGNVDGIDENTDTAQPSRDSAAVTSDALENAS